MHLNNPFLQDTLSSISREARFQPGVSVLATVGQAIAGVLMLSLLSGCEAEKPVHTVEVAAQGILSASFPAMPDRVVLGSIHHGGSLWDIQTEERLFNWNHKPNEYSTFRQASMSGDGKVAATVEDANIGVWSAVDGTSLNFWQAADKVLAMQINQTGQHALLGLDNQQAVYFDLTEGRAIYEFVHEAEVFAVDISADGRLAITGADDKIVRLFSLEDGTERHRLAFENQVKSVALSADGALAFSAAQREDAVIWNTDTGELVSRLPFRYENYTAARFSRDSKRILLGTFQGDVYLADALTGEEIYRWKTATRSVWGPASSNAVLAVAFATDGSVLAVSSDGFVQRFRAPQ